MAGWIAGATVGGAILGSMSADSAKSAQEKSAQKALDAQNAQLAQTRADTAPWREAGARALGQLESDINTPTTAADVMSDPGYQFGLQQGQLALDRKTAAAGGRLSGAALKAASEYGTNYATTGYGAAYQRRQDRLNRLAALAGIGQTATTGTALAGTNAANAIGSVNMQQGANTGAATLAQGNIWSNALNSLGAVGNRWANNQKTGNVNNSYGGYQDLGFGTYGE